MIDRFLVHPQTENPNPRGGSSMNATNPGNFSFSPKSQSRTFPSCLPRDGTSPFDKKSANQQLHRDPATRQRRYSKKSISDKRMLEFNKPCFETV